MMSSDGTPGYPRSGDGLHRRDDHALDAERLMDRRERQRRDDRRAVSVRDDRARPAAILPLRLDHAEVIRVDLGDDERHVRIHPIVLRVGQHRACRRARTPARRRPPRLNRAPRRRCRPSTRSGSHGWTVMSATYGGMSPAPTHRAASRYGLPAERSDAASETISNHGCPTSRRMNVCPTAPVAPRIATRRRLPGLGEGGFEDTGITRAES